MISLCEVAPHVNIVNILKHGHLVPDRVYYIDMELCDFSLDEFIHGRRPSKRNGNVGTALPTFMVENDSMTELSNLCTIVADIASGLAFIHCQQYIHGDLNPKNGIEPSNVRLP